MLTSKEAFYQINTAPQDFYEGFKFVRFTKFHYKHITMKKSACHYKFKHAIKLL